MSTIQFNETNKAFMSSDKVLSFIENEDKVTVILANGFKKGSDTEDVFRGIMGDEQFENNCDMMDALEAECSVQHTFFISNAKKETPFNEKGMVKRLIKDGLWTSIILHSRPLKQGYYAMVVKGEDIVLEESLTDILVHQERGEIDTSTSPTLVENEVIEVVKVDSVVKELEFQKNAMVEHMKHWNMNEDAMNTAICYFDLAVHGVEEHLKQYRLTEGEN